jgi:hypothetical protein
MEEHTVFMETFLELQETADDNIPDTAEERNETETEQ